MPRKRVQVVERKLGREQADAQVDLEIGLIEIDPRLPSKKWLSRLCHEALHVAFPDMDEKQIRAAENKIADIVWRAGVRRIHLK